MSDQSYNGWKNYETWAVGMYLDGNHDGEGLYREVLALVAETDPFGVGEVAEVLKSWFGENLPEVGGIAGDLLGAAVSDIDWQELAGHKVDEIREGWISEAKSLGKDAAESAASWIADGNSSETAIRSMLIAIEAGGIPDSWRTPNLSGEFADDPTPDSIVTDVTGLDSVDEITSGLIADAWENGVSENFESACVAELTRWIS